MHELIDIIKGFKELFEEQKTLPPKRDHDHTFPLIQGDKPINIGPYKYSFDQKNTIENIVEEMLTVGVITTGTSSFASLVLLVPKKDNTWRFCIDYIWF